MKEAAFIMAEYSVGDPFALTPRVWGGLIHEATRRAEAEGASCG